jgi:nitroimidazol reductase NimA-like FMN-containing flavoprotein (pyridoxamine 5'-phosphate oxidase superfamily)
VHETEDDLNSVQGLLDRSFELAGTHLLEVITPDRRMPAAEVCDRLTDMRLLALATVTADGRPLVGPVDGIFYRGAFHFSSSPDSVRIRHLRSRPQVSATHLPGESFAVTVHGEAELLDLSSGPHAGLRKVLLDHYVPQYGAEWEAFLDANVCARINARRMFVFHLR